MRSRRKACWRLSTKAPRSAVRALQEGAMLLLHLAQQDAAREDEGSKLDRAAQEKLQQAVLVRKSLGTRAKREAVSVA
jgi:hypothetical protein